MCLIKKILLSLLCTLVCYTSFASTPKIPKQFQQNLSVIVMNDKTGQLVYSYKSNTPRLVASNMKLVTTAVGLEQLHSDFRWHTKLFYTGTINNGTLTGNIYILGGGDPTFDDRALEEIFSQLKKMNIRKINGDIVIDNTIFNSLPSYSMLKIENYDVDTTLPNGFIIDSNSTTFTLHVKKHKVAIDNNLYNYLIVNELTVDNSLTTCPDLSKMITLQNKTITFSGGISTACNNTKLEFNMVPYKDYTQMAIKRTLAKLSTGLNGNIVYASAPNKAFLIYDYSSQSLEDAFIYMNHYSINLIAETALLSLGAYTTSNDNTYLKAKQVYTEYMRNNHILNQEFKLENGAGLSRYEFMRATDMAHLLWLMSHSDFKTNFENTLPEASHDGTLKQTFTKFGSRVKFKTGTLNDTRAYSGYFYSKKGTKYIVVVIANKINTNNDKVNRTLNNWISKLLSQLQ